MPSIDLLIIIVLLKIFYVLVSRDAFNLLIIIVIVL